MSWPGAAIASQSNPPRASMSPGRITASKVKRSATCPAKSSHSASVSQRAMASASPSGTWMGHPNARCTAAFPPMWSEWQCVFRRRCSGRPSSASRTRRSVSSIPETWPASTRTFSSGPRNRMWLALSQSRTRTWRVAGSIGGATGVRRQALGIRRQALGVRRKAKGERRKAKGERRKAKGERRKAKGERRGRRPLPRPLSRERARGGPVIGAGRFG